MKRKSSRKRLLILKNSCQRQSLRKSRKMIRKQSNNLKIKKKRRRRNWQKSMKRMKSCKINSNRCRKNSTGISKMGLQLAQIKQDNKVIRLLRLKLSRSTESLPQLPMVLSTTILRCLRKSNQMDKNLICLLIACTYLDQNQSM